MRVNWTPEQEKAVYGAKANCLVSAAAGSGKTQVLTGRILRRVLEEGIDIHRILVVTFTNAAAAEMRARISESLSEALARDPENKHLQKQLSLLGSASITTMDAFCLQLLRTHFVEAGIDGGFRICDAAEANLLRSEAAHEALEEMYGSGDKAFLEFADCYSRMKDDSILCEIAISLYSFAESMPDPEAWLRDKAKLYAMVDGDAFRKSPYAKAILEGVVRELSGAAERCAYAQAAFAEAQSYAEVFAADRLMLLSLCEKGRDWDTLYDGIAMFAWSRRRRETKSALTDEAEEVRKDIKKQVDEACDRIYCDAEECAAIMRRAEPHVRALCALTQKFSEIYARLKREKNVLDYSDLEHFAIRLLSEDTSKGRKPSAIACTLRDKYDEIYIDEYQDSNDVQELLFTLLSGESVGQPNMFMVGDMKQSIYGFRKTSPELFVQKSELYREEGPNRRITLSRNFRSRPEILRFVNQVFAQIMCREVGGIDYTEKERLYPGAAYPEAEGPFVEFAIADTDGKAVQRLENEASLVAEKIQEALKTKVYDLKKGTYRPAQYGDIAVIMRTARDMAAPLRAICERMEIPLYCDVGGGYFETVEISVFLSLLRTIDNPQDDIPLLSTMRAPFFAFTEDELARIRLADRERLFYFAVVATAREKTSLGAKCGAFLKKLRTWRRLAAFLPTDTLILRLFEETGYLRFVSGTEGGDVKKANLELLFEKAHHFEATSFRGLFHFLRYLERMVSRGEEVGEAKLISEGENVVRLMSIHKSKGLEFPIVILAGTQRQFSRESVKGSFLLHKDLGIGISHVEPDRRIRYETPARIAVAIQKKNEEVGEELRVLYVALTRAKERLIITGSIAADAFLKNCRGGLSPSEILHAGSFLTLLGRAAQNVDNVKINVLPPPKQREVKKEVKKTVTPIAPTEGVRNILAYTYPAPDLQKIPSKISVTEYKRLKEEGDEISLPLYRATTLRTPRFLNMGGNIRGADMGTLMHFIMQNIPFRTVRTLQEIRSYIASLAKKRILSEEQAEAVDAEKLFAFWDGEIGHRIRKSEKVYREMPFTQTIPASLLTGDSAHKNEKIVMQGIIDCFFFEKDGIVLLDYKTDAPQPKNKIAERYKTQLECYAMALRQKYFSEISQKIIYLFANNGIIVV
ncbi:MAG: helicase-exonuclease AddAB subunit AddA [Ruminococcaceae bacterium]|nr:helicase-exonuclease AddAB subunit AddA [Oscillospiraceae bacterium]